MKTLCTSLRATLIAFAYFLSGCTDNAVAPQQAVVAVDEVSENADASRKKTSAISMFSVDGRDYDFTYDEDGRISSIDVTSGDELIYQYVVRYDGDRLVAADLVENGQVMSSNRNFEFDKKGRVIAFDYVSFFFPDDFPGGLVQHNTLMYDHRGNLVGMNGVEFLTYDPHRNIIQWHDDTFTYDHKKSNPLNSIPNLWLVFVEEFGYAELILSADLSTSKTVTNVSTTSTTTYVHQYNSAGQLISKVGTTNGTVTERYRFSY